MKLYKYCSAKSGLEIIRHYRVFLSHPSDFNDPFDSIFDIKEEDIKEAKDTIINYEAFKGLFDTFHRNDLKLKSSAEKFFINGLRKEFDICKALMKKTKTYEKISSLNSSLKRLSNLNPTLKAKIDKFYKEFESQTIDPLKKVADEVLISCFSRIPDSILMWSHYANSHKGICIEIDEESPEFNNVIYSNHRAKFDLVTIVKKILAAEYFGTDVDLSDNRTNFELLRPYFTKSTDWKYEEEVRCVFSRKNSIENFVIHDGIPYYKVKISKIYVGMNIKEDDLNEVLKLAMARNIPVVYMEKHPTDFALVQNNTRKQKPIFKQEPDLNPVELLFKEMEKCLDNNLYIPALFIGLAIPEIMASIVYKDMSPRDGYVELLRNTYEQYQPQGEPETPYICGELCYELKQSLFEKGTIKVPTHIKDFDLESIQLITERKKNYEIFISAVTTGTHEDGSTLNSLQFNVREFCTRLPELCKKLLDDNKTAFDRMPKIDIFNRDKEYEDMVECAIHSKTINDQLIRYAQLKTQNKAK